MCVGNKTAGKMSSRAKLKLTLEESCKGKTITSLLYYVSLFMLGWKLESSGNDTSWWRLKMATYVLYHNRRLSNLVLWTFVRKEIKNVL